MFQPNLDAGKVEDASLQTQTKAKLVKVTVTGFLIEDGLPMPMVDIKIKGKRAKTSTDFDGKFTIDAKIGDIITASYVGYETYEHIITLDDNNLIINMRPDVTELSGVVVTGGSRKRTFFGRIVRDVRNWFR
ncbi:CarboxypepD_reg-like domain-containing protein [Flavobacterium caeni]|uniref:CarboxypepD_reg-like domain-containing protein n=2 Tax=Flavobacterium caeni TaxID=490189 RepID=A0A1G5CQV4_9FLAO|nr:CarboxypepD_reg-like domain-containing protein [Flavobacterium caeni]